MIRFFIGLFVGLGIAAAAAQIGYDQDRTARALQVDRQGYVICSDEQKPFEAKPNGQ